MVETKKSEVETTSNATSKPVKAKKERKEGFNMTFGRTTYRRVITRLNKWRKETGISNIEIELKKVGSTLEAWVNFGENGILLTDNILLADKEKTLTTLKVLRNQLLEKKYNVNLITK